jgi:hypothetical protein
LAIPADLDHALAAAEEVLKHDPYVMFDNHSVYAAAPVSVESGRATPAGGTSDCDTAVPVTRGSKNVSGRELIGRDSQRLNWWP